MKDSNNPTRAEFIDLTLELEIDSVIKRQMEGTHATHEHNLKFLKKIKDQFVTIEFADDEKRKELVHELKESIRNQKELILKLKDKEKKLSRKHTEGRPKGSLKKDLFQEAYKIHGANMKYDVYEKFCIKRKVEEKDCYSDRSFRREMSRMQDFGQ